MEKSVQDFIGLTLIQADILAEQRDYNTRVVKVDSVSVPLSEGTRNNRVNFEVETPLKLRRQFTCTPKGKQTLMKYVDAHDKEIKVVNAFIA